jgi:seryl-tRNA synthetase
VLLIQFMIDLKFLRADAEKVKAHAVLKGFDEAAPIIDSVLEFDERRRALLFEVEALKKQRNENSQAVAKLKKNGEDASELVASTRNIGEKISALDEQSREVQESLDKLALEVPNTFEDDVPPGKGEDENVEVRSWGEKPQFAFEAKAHYELGETLGILDFERAARISGARFSLLRGAGAKLERALISLMLDIQTERNGYEEILPPVLVRPEAMTGAGVLPKFGDDAYHIGSDDLWLVPTAEVPVTAMLAGEILEAAQLPMKFAAYSPCFRREAGSAGRDTRGLIRVHQFDKVELVKFVAPEYSRAELESLTRDAESVLEALELPYRTVEHCTGDLGFKASKAYDVEVWMPAQQTYREISSCSMFDAFQARRLNIRYRPLEDNGKAGKPEFVHTLNGSGLAVGRTMAAILENFQSQDGSVRVPQALQPYMNGLEIISA